MIKNHSTPKKLPSIQLLSQLFYLDVNGVLRWTGNGNRKTAGSVAGTPVRKGYWRVVIQGKSYFRHRIVWALHKGEDPGDRQIDHRDNVQGNDDPLNLRVAVNHQNLGNRSKNANNTSGFKGVSFCKAKGKWRATITIYGKQKWLGYFGSPEAAHVAYSEAANQYFREFARAV